MVYEHEEYGTAEVLFELGEDGRPQARAVQFGMFVPAEEVEELVRLLPGQQEPGGWNPVDSRV